MLGYLLNKERKGEKLVKIKRSKLITPRTWTTKNGLEKRTWTTKEDLLKMKAKIELKSEEEKSKRCENNHCIMCGGTFEENWIRC